MSAGLQRLSKPRPLTSEQEAPAGSAWSCPRPAPWAISLVPLCVQSTPVRSGSSGRTGPGLCSPRGRRLRCRPRSCLGKPVLTGQSCSCRGRALVTDRSTKAQQPWLRLPWHPGPGCRLPAWAPGTSGRREPRCRSSHLGARRGRPRGQVQVRGRRTCPTAHFPRPWPQATGGGGPASSQQTGRGPEQLCRPADWGG